MFAGPEFNILLFSDFVRFVNMASRNVSFKSDKGFEFFWTIFTRPGIFNLVLRPLVVAKDASLFELLATNVTNEGKGVVMVN